MAGRRWRRERARDRLLDAAHRPRRGRARHRDDRARCARRARWCRSARCACRGGSLRCGGALREPGQSRRPDPQGVDRPCTASPTPWWRPRRPSPRWRRRWRPSSAASIVIGHAIAYDLAVLEREYGLAGRSWPALPRASTCARWRGWRRPRWPTTASTGCASGSASRSKGRHTALGDARGRRARCSWRWCRCCAPRTSARWPRPRQRAGRWPSGRRAAPAATRRRPPGSAADDARAGADRQLSLPPPRARRHERAGPVRRAEHDGARRGAPADREGCEQRVRARRLGR